MVATGHTHDFAVTRAWKLTCECGHVEWVDTDPRRSPAKPRPTSFDHLRWQSMYRDGMTIGEIATSVGAAYYAVRRALLALGTDLHRGRRRGGPGLMDMERARAIEVALTRDDRTLAEVGQEYGISRERVRQIAVKMGVDTAALRRRRSERRAEARRTRVCPVHGPYVVGAERHNGCHNRLVLHPEWKARDERIAADYRAGLPIAQIMAKHGVAATAVSRAIRREGVPRRMPHQGRCGSMAEIRARKEAIADAVRSGKRVDEVAARFRCSTSWVRMVAREAGL